MSRALFSSLRLSRPSSSQSFARSIRTPRRFNSTTSTQEKAKEAASKAQDKTREAIATAQNGFVRIVDAAKKATGSAGERVGILLGAYRQPILYNLAVARELLKQVYIAERLQPPTSIGTVMSAYQMIWNYASSPTFWSEAFRTREYKRIVIYAIEAYGIFKIGEIIGRRSLFGYKPE